MRNQEVASAYGEALILGAVELDEIVSWADSRVLADKDPSRPLLDLSFSKSKGEALSALYELSFGANEERSFKILLGLIIKGLEAGSLSYRDAAKRLFLWNAFDPSTNRHEKLSFYWDALKFAEGRYQGEAKQLKREMLEFLRERQA